MTGGTWRGSTLKTRTVGVFSSIRWVPWRGTVAGHGGMHRFLVPLMFKASQSRC